MVSRKKSKSRPRRRQEFAIVAEGRDDLAAIRELLCKDFDLKHEPMSSPPKFRDEAIEVVVLVANTKSDLARRAVDAAMPARPDIVFVCFDPNGDPPKKEFKFFEDSFKAEVKAHRAGPLERRKDK